MEDSPSVPVALPIPALGAALGVCLVAAGGPLGWADPGWVEPGYRHAPYLAVAPLALAALALVAARPTERTCLAAAFGGLVVALTAKGSIWSAGRALAFLGGTAILLASAAGYLWDPALDLRHLSIERPTPPLDGWFALAGAVVLAGLAAVVMAGQAPGIVDALGALLVAGFVLVAGSAVSLYRWGPDLRVALVAAPLVLPAAILGAPLARLVDPVVGVLVAVLAVGVTLVFGLGVLFFGDVSVVESLVGPPVALRADRGRPVSHLRTAPFACIATGLFLVVLAGALPWHARVLSFGPASALPEAGVGVPGYYLVLALATAAALVSLVRWTVPAMRVVAALGVLVTAMATGENPLDGGRAVATVGGLLVTTGGLAADRYGRDLGLSALVPRRPHAPFAGWLAFLGVLVAVAPLVVSRPLLGPTTALVTDPFVRQGPGGVLLVALSATDVGAVGAAAVLTGAALASAVACLYLGNPDVSLALALAGAVAGGWAVAALVGAGILTADGLLVVRASAAGALLLVVAGALSLFEAREGDGTAG